MKSILIAVARMRQINQERVMAMNILMLKGKMVERGFNVERLAAKMDIDRSSLYRKMNSSEKFTIGDVQKIKDILELSDNDARLIFLG